jgi:hypothetical protein
MKMKKFESMKLEKFQLDVRKIQGGAPNSSGPREFGTHDEEQQICIVDGEFTAEIRRN